MPAASIFAVPAAAITAAVLILAVGLTVKVDATGTILRVGFFDWATNPFGQLWNPDLNRACAASALLAVKHFNERSTQFIPALADLAGCTHNISVVKYCDTSGNRKKGAQMLMEMINNDGLPDFIWGAQGVTDMESMSHITDTFGGVPFISFQTTTDLFADVEEFPTIMRIQPSDYDLADRLAVVIDRLGVKNFAFLHLSDAADLAGYLKSTLVDVNMTAVQFQYDVSLEEDAAAINAAVQTVKRQSFNIIVIATWMSQLHFILDALVNNDMVGGDKFFIFCYMERGFLPSETNEKLLTVMPGSLHLTPSLGTDLPLFQNFVANWPSFGPEVSYINPHLPPFGNDETQKSCYNTALNMTLPSDFFDKSEPKEQVRYSGYAAWAYDAVMSIGFAACRANPTSIASGPTLFANLVNVSFEGVSGNVEFDPATQKRRRPYFQLFNIRKNAAGDAMELVLVGRFDRDITEVNVSEIHFRSGAGLANLPSDFTPGPHDMSLLPMWAVGVGYFEVAVLTLLCLICIGWIQWQKSHRVVINSQPQFMQLVALGCLIATWSIFALTIDDSGTTGLDPSGACMAAPVLFTVGFLLALTALVAKMRRVSIVLNSAMHLKQVRVTATRSLTYVAIVIAVEFVIIAAWIAVAPLYWVRNVTFYHADGVFPELSVGTCTGNQASIGFLAVTMSLLFIALLFSSVFANRIKHAPAELQESQYIAMALASMLQVFLIAVPATIASYFYVLGKFILLSSMITVVLLLILGFLFFPKMLWVHFGVKLFSDSNGGSNNTKGTGPEGGVGRSASKDKENNYNNLSSPNVRQIETRVTERSLKSQVDPE